MIVGARNISERDYNFLGLEVIFFSEACVEGDFEGWMDDVEKLRDIRFERSGVVWSEFFAYNVVD